MEATHTKEEILLICNQVREMLAVGGLPQIQTEFPILEMDPTKRSSSDKKGNHYLGFCQSRYTNWKTVANGKESERVIPQKIWLRLEDEQGNLVPLRAILPTFLHELAHSITVGQVLIINGEEQNDVHGELFYNNFAKILKLADQLDIYSLPPRFKNYALHTLKRFDAIDLLVASPTMCGTSKKFAATSNASENTPLRFTLMHSVNHQQKVVTITQRTEQALHQAARQKFRSKFHSFVLPGDLPLPLLCQLQDGCTIVALKNPPNPQPNNGSS